MAPLSLWRDLALVLLAVETYVVNLGAAVVLYLGLTRLRRAQAWIDPRLRLGARYARRYRVVSGRVMAATAAPFVRLQVAAAGLRRVLEVLGERRA
jgi:hypothetical protein